MKTRCKMIARKWKGKYRFKIIYFREDGKPYFSANLLGGSLDSYYVRTTFDEDQILRDFLWNRHCITNLDKCYGIFNSLKKRKRMF